MSFSTNLAYFFFPPELSDFRIEFRISELNIEFQKNKNPMSITKKSTLPEL